MLREHVSCYALSKASMRQLKHDTVKLPRQLLDELGIKEAQYGGTRGRRSGPGVRKERRKASRVEKKSRYTASLPKRHTRVNGGLLESDEDTHSLSASEEPKERSLIRLSALSAKTPKSILKVSKPVASEKSAQQPLVSTSRSLSRGVKDRLAADDAEVKALEKLLRVPKGGKLPKAFGDDGLDLLLDGLGRPGSEDDSSTTKKRRSEEDEWLQAKRKKALGRDSEEEDSNASQSNSLSDSPSGEDSDIDETFGSTSEGPSSSQQTFEGFHTDALPEDSALVRIRENPYVAPAVSQSILPTAKYVPPSLRLSDHSGQEDLKRLHRQIQGLLNRLSEANLKSILSDFEELYRNHPRQHVSGTLLDLLMGLLCDPSSLEDTFIILHAGFVAAMYRKVGVGFGAQTVQRIVQEFDSIYLLRTKGNDSVKQLTNLVSLLAELYNFQVFGSGLMYDFIRIFIEDLTEMNTELLLKIVRSSGPQLRRDDPSSLKDIVYQIQRAISKVGAENLSVRTKFMLETINSLKDNRMKTDTATSAIRSSHTRHMKDTLGSLNTRNATASEPLGVGLRAIRDTENRGKWWLVGASYRDDDESAGKTSHSQLPPGSVGAVEAASKDNNSINLIDLAREHRMNTDVRRSIFGAIMSASNIEDAHHRLLKLTLSKGQKPEIPKVLIHCASKEKEYNLYHTLLAKRLIADTKLKLKVPFQYSLWGIFRRMGENGDEDEEDRAEDKIEMREIVNLAKMFGTLVAEGVLPLSILKNLDLAYLQPTTRTFVELFLIKVIVHSQQGSTAKRNEKPLMNTVLRLKDVSNLVRGLQYFVRKVVSKTDVAGSKVDEATVKWGCKVITNALAALASSSIADE